MIDTDNPDWSITNQWSAAGCLITSSNISPFCFELKFYTLLTRTQYFEVRHCWPWFKNKIIIKCQSKKKKVEKYNINIIL